MKTLIISVLTAALFLTAPIRLFSQPDPIKQDFGISVGGFTNFPANQHYLTDYKSALYVSPYIQVGRHEFSAGLLYPMQAGNLHFSDYKIDPRPGFILAYKFYVFDPYGRENLFIHYSLQYMRYKGGYDIPSSSGIPADHYTETDMYINNVIGLGYNLYFDMDNRFGLFYTLDYIISQTSYQLTSSTSDNNTWYTGYVWNNLSTHIGLIFKLAPLKKKARK